MRQRQTFFSFLAVLAIVGMFFSTPVEATQRVIEDALQEGGERLVDLQNADGGWFFTVGDTDCGSGPGVSCPNTMGVTGLALIDAYRMTKDPDFKVAAFKTGDALVAKFLAGPPCDGDPFTGTDRGFTVDHKFLVELATLGGPKAKTYRSTGIAWFKCVMLDFPNAADRADNRIDGRIAQNLSNLGEWDAALDIEAALAVGQKAYALAETLRVIARQGDWDVTDPDCPGCENLGKGLLLQVTKSLPSNNVVKAAIAGWTSDLLAGQLTNGSWNEDTQTTSYVLLGLDMVTKTSAVKKAISKGLLYLFSQGIGNGGYFIGTGQTDEITEVDSEVLQALYANR